MLLVTGYWLLVTGYWLLVTGYCQSRRKVFHHSGEDKKNSGGLPVTSYKLLVTKCSSIFINR